MATCSSGDGAELQPELCNTCVEALARGLAAARSGAAATAAQLDVMRSGLWCQTMLPLVDLLFHSTRWYETCQQESEAMQGFFRVRESAREMVKSSFLPLLGEAAVQQAPGTGFRLGDVFHKVLDIGKHWVRACMHGVLAAGALVLPGRPREPPPPTLHVNGCHQATWLPTAPGLCSSQGSQHTGHAG